MNLRRSIPILLVVLIALASVHSIAGSEPSPRLLEVTMPLRCTTIEQLKRLYNLSNDTVIPGWKLLVQKGATQPAPAARPYKA